MHSTVESFQVSKCAIRHDPKATPMRLDLVDVEILRQLAAGRSRGDLIWRLGMSERTLRRRLSRIKRCLETETTISAVASAVRQQII